MEEKIFVFFFAGTQQHFQTPSGGAERELSCATMKELLQTHWFEPLLFVELPYFSKSGWIIPPQIPYETLRNS